jgi:hypothetical protein
MDFDCDACCSASGGRVLVLLNSNFVGIRYFNQSYRDGILPLSSGLMKISRLKFGLKSHYLINKIAALIPYHFHNRELTGTENISGLVILRLWLRILCIRHKRTVPFLHTNIQNAYGLFNNLRNQKSFNWEPEVGLFVTEYMIKKKNLGLNSMLNYNIKTENSKK